MGTTPWPRWLEQTWVQQSMGLRFARVMRPGQQYVRWLRSVHLAP